MERLVRSMSETEYIAQRTVTSQFRLSTSSLTRNETPVDFSDGALHKRRVKTLVEVFRAILIARFYNDFAPDRLLLIVLEFLLAAERRALVVGKLGHGAGYRCSNWL